MKEKVIYVILLLSNRGRCVITLFCFVCLVSARRIKVLDGGESSLKTVNSVQKVQVNILYYYLLNSFVHSNRVALLWTCNCCNRLGILDNYRSYISFIATNINSISIHQTCTTYNLGVNTCARYKMFIKAKLLVSSITIAS